MTRFFAAIFRWSCAGCAALMLTACLGGGGGSKSATGSSGQTPVSQPVASPPAPSNGGATPQDPPPPATPTNAAPVISGSPASTATVAETYAFQPTATDANGDSLTFQIENMPSWATFNASTGRIDGRPSAEHVGTYSNVRVSVSDGEDTATLRPFTITVEAIGNGQFTVSWSAPTANTDGSTLTDLAGYKIYYGQSKNTLDKVLKVSAGLTTAVIENLAAGTWYIAMTSYNAANIESQRTAAISKTI